MRPARRSSRGDALKMLRDEGPLTPMAGCTDLYVALNFGTLEETAVSRPLAARRAADHRDARGTCCGSARWQPTPTSSDRHSCAGDFRCWRRRRAKSGGVQIQNRGTIGGNVANASPAGDTLPVLAAADAVVHLQSAAGIAPRAVHLVLHRLPRDGPAAGRAHRRVRGAHGARPTSVPESRHTRRAGDLEGRAGRRQLGDDARLASVPSAPTVRRRAGRRRHLRRAASRVSAGNIAEEIAPIDDIRSTAEYRRRVALNLLARMLEGGSRAPAVRAGERRRA